MTRFLPGALLALTLAGTACAGRLGSPDTPSAPRRIGPDRPDLSAWYNGQRTSTLVVGPRRPPLEAELTVMIDPDGFPDMMTLKISGSGAALVEQALSDWVLRGRYEPGKLNGQPTRAQFRYRVKADERRR